MEPVARRSPTLRSCACRAGAVRRRRQPCPASAVARIPLSAGRGRPERRARGLDGGEGAGAVARIYVSSTFRDLKEHRHEVSLALHRLGHQDVAMEYYVAEDRRPLDRCLADVTSCDVYIGIF